MSTITLIDMDSLSDTSLSSLGPVTWCIIEEDENLDEEKSTGLLNNYQYCGLHVGYLRYVEKILKIL